MIVCQIFALKRFIDIQSLTCGFQCGPLAIMCEGLECSTSLLQAPQYILTTTNPSLVLQSRRKKRSQSPSKPLYLGRA